MTRFNGFNADGFNGLRASGFNARGRLSRTCIDIPHLDVTFANLNESACVGVCTGFFYDSSYFKVVSLGGANGTFRVSNSVSPCDYRLVTTISPGMVVDFYQNSACSGSPVRRTVTDAWIRVRLDSDLKINLVSFFFPNVETYPGTTKQYQNMSIFAYSLGSSFALGGTVNNENQCGNDIQVAGGGTATVVEP